LESQNFEVFGIYVIKHNTFNKNRNTIIMEKDIAEWALKVWHENKQLKNKIKVLERENKMLKEKLFGVEYA